MEKITKKQHFANLRMILHQEWDNPDIKMITMVLASVVDELTPETDEDK